MKKIFAFLMTAMLAVGLFAEEAVLFKADGKSDLDGYDFMSNFEITSESGYFNQSNLFLKYSETDGLKAIALDVPQSVSTHYSVLVPYPSFINESGAGTGCIYNAAAIKTINVTMKTNRPYDEIILLYSTSPNGVVNEIKMPQNFNEVHSMEETTLVFNNPLYEDDVTKRELKANPVLGSEGNGIYLRGFRIKTNAPSGYNAYSPYSVVYIKEVTVTYDKRFTDEQIENMNMLKDEFGIDENEVTVEKAKKLLEEKRRLRDTEETLKHKDTSTEE